MAPKSFLDCPGELQADILRLLPFPDLVSLSLVSKNARSLAEPLLYADISLTWTWDHLPGLAPLLRTLLEKPGLSHHVRNLHLNGTGFTKKFNHANVEPPALSVSALPLESASARIRSTGVPHAQQWVDELEAGAADALVALLVSMLPNLACLHLDANFTIVNTYLGHLLRCALATDSDATKVDLPKFPHLRQVTFSRRTHEWRHRNVNNSADVLPFFFLPNVRRLSISIDNPKEFAWPTARTPAPITSLELFRLRETRLGPLLSRLRSLRALHWHWYYQENIDSHAGGPVIQLNAMAEALSHVADTLTDLTIEAETAPDILGGEYEPPHVESQGSLKALGKLTNLRTLCLPWLFLMGSSPLAAVESAVGLGELLPPSIEVLTMTGELLDHEQFNWQDDIIVQAIESALGNQNAMSQLTKLQRIVLPIPFDDSMSEETRARLQQLSDRSGILLDSEDDQ